MLGVQAGDMRPQVGEDTGSDIPLGKSDAQGAVGVDDGLVVEVGSCVGVGRAAAARLQSARSRQQANQPCEA